MTRKSFLTGASYALVYYATAAILAFLSYWLIGHGYLHAPGLHHFILLISWIGGILWALFSIYKRFQGKDVAFYRGTALVNLLIVAGAFVWFIQQLQPATEGLPHSSGSDVLTTEFSGDTAIVRHQGDIVFLRIGDSIYFDELSRFYQTDSLSEKKDTF